MSYFHRFDFDIRSPKAITYLIVSKLLCSMVNASYVVWVGLFVPRSHKVLRLKLKYACDGAC